MTGEKKPGRIGRIWPALSSPPAIINQGNSAPTANASVVEGRVNLVLAIVAILSLILAVLAWNDARQVQNEVERLRGLLEGAAASASEAAVNAAVAAERADKAERSAAINREYAVQVFPQLNRMGYHVLSPGEVDHPVAQPEDYEKLDAYAERRRREQP